MIEYIVAGILLVIVIIFVYYYNKLNLTMSHQTVTPFAVIDFAANKVFGLIWSNDDVFIW